MAPTDFIEELGPQPGNKDFKTYKRIRLNNGTTIMLVSEIPRGGENEYDFFEFPLVKRVPNVLDWSNGGDRVLGLGPHIRQTSANPSTMDDNPQHFHPFACAMVVGAGFLDEPTEYPGLAHLYEHVVFNEKLESSISDAGADFNAVTQMEITSFFFTTEYVDPEGIEMAGILRKFSDMFRTCNMTIEKIKIEVDAMEFEFRRFDRDTISREEILKSCVQPDDHPLKRFHAGNWSTLLCDSENEWETLQAALETFQNKQYVAPNITVVLQGFLSVEKLQQIAIQYFNDLRPGELPDKSVVAKYKHPFQNKDFCNKIYSIKPHIPADLLYLTWSLPPSAWQNYKTKPLEYVNNVISSGVEGGMANKLMESNLIVSLESGVQNNFQSRYGTLYTIKMELTELGVNNIDQIFGIVFGFINTIMEKGVCSKIYENQKVILETNFNVDTQIRSTAESARFIAESLLKYLPADLLTGPSLLFDFEENQIYDILRELSREKLNSMLISHGFKDTIFQDYLPRADCRFTKQSLSEKRRDTWPNQTSFILPNKKNPYRTDNYAKNNRTSNRNMVVTLRPHNGVLGTLIPRLLAVPMSSFRLLLSADVGNDLAFCEASLKILCTSITIACDQCIREASEVAMKTTVSAESPGQIDIEVAGFDSPARKLFVRLAEEILAPPFLEDKILHLFEHVKDKELKDLYRVLASAKEHGNKLFERALRIGSVKPTDIHSRMRSIEKEDFKIFSSNFLKNGKLRVDIVGNTLLRIANMVLKRVAELKMKDRENQNNPLIGRLPIIKLQSGRNIWQIWAPKVQNPVSYLKLYIQLEEDNHPSSELAECIFVALRIEFYFYIRSKPYGYECDVEFTHENGICGMQFFVQYDAEITGDQMILAMDKFLYNFYNKNVRRLTPSKLKQWMQRVPYMANLANFTIPQLQELFKNRLKPSSVIFKGLYIQVIGRGLEKGEPDVKKWNRYRKPYALEQVDNSGRVTKPPKMGPTTTYIRDIERFHENGTIIP